MPIDRPKEHEGQSAIAQSGPVFGREEFEETPTGALAGGGDQRRDNGRRGMDDELAHGYRSLWWR